ncbi:MAG: hypothetical protein EOO11_06585 [Chitinophagaceae bacterium]|nr:MAG: hypothetical protein EOO11_06585 [Chitinophagaceae bacterium]
MPKLDFESATMLKKYIGELQNLEYNNFAKAEEIRCYMQHLARKRFTNIPHILETINSAKFENNHRSHSAKRNSWKAAQGNLSGVANFMLEELLQTKKDGERKSNLNEKYTGTIFCLVASTLLWIVFYYSSWEWINHHPKKLSLFISIQLLVGCIAFMIYHKKKKIEIGEGLAIISSLLFGVISYLDK